MVSYYYMLRGVPPHQDIFNYDFLERFSLEVVQGHMMPQRHVPGHPCQAHLKSNGRKLALGNETGVSDSGCRWLIDLFF